MRTRFLQPCVLCGFYIMTVVILMTHACLGWRISRWHRTQISHGASLLCEVSRIPLFLSNRFGVDFFSSLRPLFTAREYRVSEMKTQRNCHQNECERLYYHRWSMHRWQLISKSLVLSSLPTQDLVLISLKTHSWQLVVQILCTFRQRR